VFFFLLTLGKKDHAKPLLGPFAGLFTKSILKFILFDGLFRYIRDWIEGMITYDMGS